MMPFSSSEYSTALLLSSINIDVDLQQSSIKSYLRQSISHSPVS
jgi:hypothetical protein